ncbi:MAG: hypothetical protein WA317_02515 [Mycobacterium sp.]|uniref:hypothetical protein n=1 Tax=Mycobacterium sp. TaxID=1785 RepID=UPI003CC5D664
MTATGASRSGTRLQAVFPVAVAARRAAARWDLGRGEVNGWFCGQAACGAGLDAAKGRAMLDAAVAVAKRAGVTTSSIPRRFQ